MQPFNQAPMLNWFKHYKQRLTEHPRCRIYSFCIQKSEFRNSKQCIPTTLILLGIRAQSRWIHTAMKEVISLQISRNRRIMSDSHFLNHISQERPPDIFLSYPDQILNAVPSWDEAFIRYCFHLSVCYLNHKLPLLHDLNIFFHL